MTKHMRIILALLVAVVLPASARAFDDSRQGFILGLGGGYGSAKWSVGNQSESWGGLATTLKVGGGPTEQLLVYYSNRVVFFSASDLNFVQGMSGAAVSYFLNPYAPSFFFSGELGLGVAAMLESGGDSESGFGFTIGAGFEASPHLILEANYMWADLGDTSFDWSISNFTFTVSWLGF